jgi:hypothetical protein
MYSKTTSARGYFSTEGSMLSTEGGTFSTNVIKSLMKAKILSANIKKVNYLNRRGTERVMFSVVGVMTPGDWVNHN